MRQRPGRDSRRASRGLPPARLPGPRRCRRVRPRWGIRPARGLPARPGRPAAELARPAQPVMRARKAAAPARKARRVRAPCHGRPVSSARARRPPAGPIAGAATCRHRLVLRLPAIGRSRRWLRPATLATQRAHLPAPRAPRASGAASLPAARASRMRASNASIVAARGPPGTQTPGFGLANPGGRLWRSRPAVDLNIRP